MVKAFGERLLSVTLSALLVVTTLPSEAGAQQQQQPAQNQQGGGPAPFSANDLQQLVAPIALYPDALVAQVLGAATFPDQVQAADGWLQQNKNLTGNALMQAVDKQPWDPSVKALTQFPSVMDNLAKNLQWTSTLGEAYHNQATDVMAAVQKLRAEAKAAGNLKSGSQITVVQESPQTIVIQPANPQVVYVPQYNPTVVYGTPYQPPGYSAGDMAAASILSFGVGIAVGAAIANNNSCCGWGYSSWNCNWHGGTVVYSNNVYYGNNAWHGGAYGSCVPARRIPGTRPKSAEPNRCCCAASPASAASRSQCSCRHSHSPPRTCRRWQTDPQHSCRSHPKTQQLCRRPRFVQSLWSRTRSTDAGYMRSRHSC
jgi:hypothetical protein